MSNPKRVIWFSADTEPAPAQVRELRRLYPRCEIITVLDRFNSVDGIIDKYNELEGDEIVAVLPLTMIRAITQRGYPIIWTMMEQVYGPHEDWDIVSEKHGRVKKYRFDGFLKLRKVRMVFEKIDPEPDPYDAE